jgi:hypothetical protein
MQTSVLTLKRLGVQLDWIMLDEPVWFGHYDTEVGACQLSMPDLIRLTASIVSPIVAVYPDIKIIEGEPVPVLTEASDWRQCLSEFQEGMARETGRKMQGMHIDMDWHNPDWKQAVTDLNVFLDQRNMDLGIYYDATIQELSDADWINHAVSNFEALEGSVGITPAHAIFASWNVYGQLVMPETFPVTQTWLINRYVRERSLLTVEFVGQGAHGRLTTEHGKPIANATVRAYVPGVDFSQPLPVVVVQGIVPPTAAYAVVGFRLNAECQCSGLDDVLAGSIHYQEIVGGSAEGDFTLAANPRTYGAVIVDGEVVGGTRVARVIAPVGVPFLPNTLLFPVTPGATYQFSMAAGTMGGTGWYGGVILIWFDQTQWGFLRVTVTPDPSRRLVATVTTAADGTFVIPNMPRVGAGSAPVTVEYDGGGIYRSVAWSPLR